MPTIRGGYPQPSTQFHPTQPFNHPHPIRASDA
jgi:hypothetical protein